MKSYASGELQAMHMLLFRSAKFTFMLLLCLMLPLMLEIDFVLGLWLKQVPEYTNVFVCFMLCISMIDAVSNPFMTASAATGKVKVYQSVVGGILLMIVPIAYVTLRLGAEPYAVFVVHFSVAVFAFLARLTIVKRLINLSVRRYIGEVILPCSFVMIPSVLFSIGIKNILPNSLAYAFTMIFLSFLLVVMFSLLLGLTRNERKFILSKIPILQQRR